MHRPIGAHSGRAKQRWQRGRTRTTIIRSIRDGEEGKGDEQIINVVRVVRVI